MYDELVKRLMYCRNNAAIITDEELVEIAEEAADAIEELLQKEKFHAFLWNVINPNDMQLYLEMYHSGDEKEKTE